MTDMLQKSENVAKNVANENSQDLTEQWKKGELPSGWYYLKVNEELANNPVIAECVVDYSLGLPISYFYDFDIAKIEQVLAPVPSYDEWQALKASYQMSNDANLKQAMWMADMEKENAQLKEMLKEIRRKIKTVYDMDLNQFITSAAFTDDFVKKIDEVLRCGNIK